MNQEQKLLNRIAELETQLAAVQQGVQWTPGENDWNSWCSKWFGPDADDDYLAKAVFHLPQIAQKFATHPTQQGLDARRERDNIFFLAGWNGRNEGLDAHEQFKKATIAAQAKQGGEANG